MVNTIYEGMTINRVPLGSSSCSSEIVKVETKDGTTKHVQLFYDSGSQLTIFTQYCAPMATYARKSQKPISITILY